VKYSFPTLVCESECKVSDVVIEKDGKVPGSITERRGEMEYLTCDKMKEV